jgi:hypothetical protein
MISSQSARSKSDLGVTSRAPRRVSFSDVEVREFDVTFLKNHPKEAALSLDWKFTECPSESVVDYEKKRSPFRRSKSQLVMDTAERKRRLVQDFGFTLRELACANRFVLGRSISVPSKIASSRRDDATRRQSSRSLKREVNAAR